jgi:hypothetical protein
MKIDIEPGRLAVTVSAFYDVPGWDPDDLTPGLLTDYANQCGLLTAMPFLRVEVRDLALRVLALRVLGVRAMLPVFHIGDVVLEHGTPAPASEHAGS